MPDHPKANEDGYIFNAAVNIEEEMVEMLGSKSTVSKQHRGYINVKSFDGKNH